MLETRTRYHQHLQKACLKRWLMQYLKVDTANRYRNRLRTNQMSNVYDVLRKRAIYKKSLSRRLLFFQKVHEQHLVGRGFRSLAEYHQVRKQNRTYQSALIERFYRSSLKRFVLQELRSYGEMRSQKAASKDVYARIGHQLIKKRAMKVLKYRYFLKSRERYVRQRSLNRMKQDCLGVLVYNQTIRVAERLMGTKSLTRTKSRIFDGLARYCAYKKYFSVKQEEARQMYISKVKSAFFQELNKRRVRRLKDQKQFAAVRKLRAQIYFAAWRMESKAALEERSERHLADRLFVRHIFKYMKQVCFQEQDEEQRAIRKNLRSRTMNFYRHNSRRRALRRLRENIHGSQLRRIRDEYTRTI